MDKQSAPQRMEEPRCLHCREPQPHPGAHFDCEEFTCADAMSAPRTNAAEIESAAHAHRDKVKQHLGGCPVEAHAFVCGIALGGFKAGAEWAALRKEPPALPAEVEAVLAELRDPVMRVDTKGRKTMHRRAATLLRRYAQAVAEKDRAKCPCDVHACLATVAEKDKKLQAVEALSHTHDNCDERCAGAGRLCSEIRKILREEH